MAPDDLRKALESVLPHELAQDLVAAFEEIRRDVATNTLGRSAPGKFVETVVQALQQLEAGRWEKKPNVDDYLRGLENRARSLDDGLRICAARIARSMYSLRNKRNIAHKGEVDPNTYDLRFLLGGAQWILAELVRHCTGLSMEQAGRLVDQVQAPVGLLVEVHGNRRLVLAVSTTREEILILLHSTYPDAMALAALTESMDRRQADTVRKAVKRLWEEKVIEGEPRAGYRLTQKGYGQAIAVVKRANALAPT